MKYIKSFQTTEELEAYIASAESGDYLLRDESKERTEAIRNDYKEPTPVGYDFLTFTAEQANSTVMGNAEHSNSIEYSYDGETWYDAAGVTVTLANVGDSVMYRADANGNSDYSSTFSMTGKIAASGSIMSMLHNNPDDKVIDVDYAFNYMFYGCSSLTAAPELPATTLANNCYQAMFNGCSSLTTTPSLPATTLAEYCYSSMFKGCSSLTTAPELPATTLENYCYFSMFSGCSLINDVTIHATSWDTLVSFNWLNGVAASGTIHNLGGATNIPTDSASGCPTGWTLSNE